MNSANNTNRYYWISILSFLVLISTYFVVNNAPRINDKPFKLPDQLEEKENKIKTKKARAEYFFKILKNPKTNRIPANIRSKELEFARELKRNARYKGEGDFFEWEQPGPNNVGGRTRALAMDIRNSDIMIAGGVSGGIWKSTDGGDSWTLKSSPEQSLSVTSVAQDPTNPDTWYYAAGELTGGSTTGIGGGAFLFGTGIFKSIDNGESWNKLPSTADNDNSFSSPFDFVTRIRINPQTGSVFIASNGFGILKSTDGSSFDPTPVLGRPGGYLFSDIEIESDGTIVAALSEADAGQPQNEPPGIYVSNDDGNSWTDVTPSTFPEQHRRTVLDIAPSNTNIVYTFTNVGGSGVDQDNRLHRINLGSGNSEDLSSNVPNSGTPVGFANTQGDYNMDIAIKPDDPDFVLLGTINLFRSADGFSTELADEDFDNRTDNSESRKFWVGGYDPIAHSEGNIDNYPNHHPDQHIIVFDPNNPKKVWAGHDGGLSVTQNITTTASTSDNRSVSWELKNNNYLVTQFYDISIPSASNDERIMGGAQDNGTPFFTASEPSAIDISSGDGGFSFFSETKIYVSTQNGRVVQWEKDTNGLPESGSFTQVTPDDANDQLFIHPYLLDPNDENIMYYPGGDSLWRNTDMNNFSPFNWEVVEAATQLSSFDITALDVSTNPANTLYMGSSPNDSNFLPRISKLENANTATGSTRLQSITPIGVDEGAFVHDIFVNPADGDEVLVVFSNYEVESLFHTTDGGQNWSAIQGNLGSTETFSGPSFRTAAIANVDGEKVYVVGTSIGVFSTQVIDGENTTWQQESEDFVGNVIVNDMDYRRSDETIALGTHGRGAFVGNLMLSTPIEDEQFTEVPGSFKMEQNFPNPFNPSTSIQFSLPTQSVVELTVYDLQGKEVRTLISNETRTAGSHLFNFNAEGLASGVYFYRIQAESVSGSRSFTETRKLTLIK